MNCRLNRQSQTARLGQFLFYRRQASASRSNDFLPGACQFEPFVGGGFRASRRPGRENPEPQKRHRCQSKNILSYKIAIVLLIIWVGALLTVASVSIGTASWPHTVSGRLTPTEGSADIIQRSGQNLKKINAIDLLQDTKNAASASSRRGFPS